MVGNGKQAAALLDVFVSGFKKELAHRRFMMDLNVSIETSPAMRGFHLTYMCRRKCLNTKICDESFTSLWRNCVQLFFAEESV